MLRGGGGGCDGGGGGEGRSGGGLAEVEMVKVVFSLQWEASSQTCSQWLTALQRWTSIITGQNVWTLQQVESLPVSATVSLQCDIVPSSLC